MCCSLWRGIAGVQTCVRYSVARAGLCCGVLPGFASGEPLVVYPQGPIADDCYYHASFIKGASRA
eukprot:13629514-Alexandrium_andersonii.AAC.1